MSAHHITIAKASFAAALLRPDATRVTRDDLARFHDFFEVATLSCTPRNVQPCKEWLLKYVVSSPPRTTALGKYLVSFSKHAPSETNFEGGSLCSTKAVSRRRLHILYILHDVLHHAKYHDTSLSAFSSFRNSLQSAISELIQLAGSNARIKVTRRLEDILDVWDMGQYYAAQYLANLRQALGVPSTTATEVISAIPNPTVSYDAKKELPFIMPASHGDTGVPYYDLPAGSLLPHILPNSPAPIRVDHVRALQLLAGPADPSLANTVRDFLEEVKDNDHAYRRYEDANHADIDELGQITLRDRTDGGLGETYYGWSRAFCAKMKRRKDGDQHGGEDRDPSRRGDRSYSTSISVSRSPKKRRRYSGSESDGSGSDRSAYRSDRPLSRNGYGTRGRSSDSDYRSKSPGRDGATSRQPTGPVAQPPQGPRYPSDGAPVPLPPQLSMPYAMQQMPQMFRPLPLGPNGVPILPPRPPNWVGQWPPPPPPPPLSGIDLVPPAFPIGSLPTFPPPPQHGQTHFSGYR